ncbi:MAG: SPOR domain-containing protein [bacterium]
MKNVNFFRNFQKRKNKKKILGIIFVIALLGISGASLMAQRKNLINFNFLNLKVNVNGLKAKGVKIYTQFRNKCAFLNNFLNKAKEEVRELTQSKRQEEYNEQGEQKESITQSVKPETVKPKTVTPEASKQKEIQESIKKENRKKEHPKVTPHKTIVKKNKDHKKENGHFYLEVFSSVVKSSAESNYAKLKQLGYTPVILNQPGKELMYNVYSDIFPTQAETLKMIEKLKKDGYKGELVILDDNNYTIRIASCFYKSSINEIVRILQGLDYNSRVLRETMDFRRFILIINGIQSEEEGGRIAEELKQHGYSPSILKKNSPST